jgi:ribosome modulation factor
MASPSRYRREGRNAYYRGGDAEERCPYKIGASWIAQFHRADWLEGWEQAKKADIDPPAKTANEVIDEIERIVAENAESQILNQLVQEVIDDYRAQS